MKSPLLYLLLPSSLSQAMNLLLIWRFTLYLLVNMILKILLENEWMNSHLIFKNSHFGHFIQKCKKYSLNIQMSLKISAKQ